MPTDYVAGFDTPAVLRLTGVPASTLDYWVAKELVAPSLHPSTGRRATRWWSLEDVIVIRTIKALREAGCPMQTLRRARAVLEAAGLESTTPAVLVWDGHDLLSFDRWGEARSEFRHPGQGVFHVVAIPLPEWRSEAERAIATEMDLGRRKELAAARAQRRATPVTPLRAPSGGARRTS